MRSNDATSGLAVREDRFPDAALPLGSPLPRYGFRPALEAEAPAQGLPEFVDDRIPDLPADRGFAAGHTKDEEIRVGVRFRRQPCGVTRLQPQVDVLRPRRIPVREPGILLIGDLRRRPVPQTSAAARDIAEP